MKKEDTKIVDLYDLSHTQAADFLRQFTYPWEALARIKEFILELGKTLPEDEYERRDAPEEPAVLTRFIGEDAAAYCVGDVLM